LNARVDGVSRSFDRGAAVASVLTAEENAAVAAGRAVVLDAWGHVVDSGGAVAADEDYIIVSKGARPPAVGGCLEAWVAGKALPTPMPFAKALVRHALALIREAGGAASPAGTAALTAATVRRRDEAALWDYVAPGKTAGAYDRGTFRLAGLLPDVKNLVIATRDCLTLAPGAAVFDYTGGISLIEVGTTNKVKLADYERRFGEVAGVIVCRVNGFEIEGFATAPGHDELATAARRAGLTVIVIKGGFPILDATGLPTVVPAADVIVYVAPPEFPAADVVFRFKGSDTFIGSGPLRCAVAAALWDQLATA